MKTHLLTFGLTCLMTLNTVCAQEITPPLDVVGVDTGNTVFARDSASPLEKQEEEGPIPLNVVEFDTSYVFPSRVEFASQKVGEGTALHNYFEYVRRIPIQGQWHFQVGATYDRFDFGGNARSLLPSRLQSINMPIGVSYIMYGHVGFLAQVRPGVNFERDVSSGAFDIPFEMGSFYPFIDEKLYGVWGVGTSILRDWPVVPTVGLIWVINDQWRLMGHVPEPKLIYQPMEELSFWVGGELLGGSYKVGKRSQSKLSNTVVDYTEYRVGAGVTYEPRENWEINLAAGCAVDRQFDFHRANMSYNAQPAPYIRVQITGEF